jgi:hypothetical protein
LRIPSELKTAERSVIYLLGQADRVKALPHEAGMHERFESAQFLLAGGSHGVIV